MSSVVWTYDTLEYNLRKDRKFTKRLKESCVLSTDQYFSLKYFQKNATLTKILPKRTGCVFLHKRHDCINTQASYQELLCSHTRGFTYSIKTRPENVIYMDDIICVAEIYATQLRRTSYVLVAVVYFLPPNLYPNISIRLCVSSPN